MTAEERKLLVKMAEELSGHWSPLGLGERYIIGSLLNDLRSVEAERTTPTTTRARPKTGHNVDGGE